MSLPTPWSLIPIVFPNPQVLVEDGVHYLEDGHFWVEVPGIPEEDEDEEDDPTIPFHPHTKLTFSTQPVQVR